MGVLQKRSSKSARSLDTTTSTERIVSLSGLDSLSHHLRNVLVVYSDHRPATADVVVVIALRDGSGGSDRRCRRWAVVVKAVFRR